jgi:anti-anti-sigma factor
VDAARIETCRSDLKEVVVAVSGEIDVATRAQLVSSLRAAVGMSGVKTVVVDLTHTSFIDASGIGALVLGRQAARTAGVGYRVVGIAGHVRQVLEITKMNDALAGPDRPAGDGVTGTGSTEQCACPSHRTSRPPPHRLGHVAVPPA